MNHLMLDLETLGTRPGSSLLSVGAVMFDATGTQLGDEFYENVDPVTCLEVGLTTDKATVDWWTMPDKVQARKSLEANRRTITAVCRKFVTFFVMHKAKFIWSHGSCFDVVLIEEAMRRVGITAFPWQFYNVRDTRTLFAVSGVEMPKREGIHHNALDDAKHQAKCVQAAFLKFKE